MSEERTREQQLERENRDLQMIERRQREHIAKLERALQLARDAAARAWRERERR